MDSARDDGIENPEIWQWLFIAPVFLFAGGLTAAIALISTGVSQ